MSQLLVVLLSEAGMLFLLLWMLVHIDMRPVDFICCFFCYGC